MLFLANKDHLAMLEKGVNIWNQWRLKNPLIKPDFGLANFGGAILNKADFSKANLSETNFSGANLTETNFCYTNLSGANLIGSDLSRANFTEADLIGANFSKANLSKADIAEADLIGANLSGANLSGANFSGAKLIGAKLAKANLSKADLIGSDLSKADLSGANLIGSDLSKANLRGANLRRTRLIGVKLNGAILTDCNVFGISVWGLIGLEEAEQSNLVITPRDEPVITVDNLEVAQFIYLLLRSEKIRGVIDAITSKVVLILGRFTNERKAILDVIREELRKRNYLPILFDFEKPTSRNITETVSTLAHMARFIIADITDARSIPQELERIVPRLTSVPIQPILLSSAKEYSMFEDFKPYNWVLKIHRYTDLDDLLKSLEEKVIVPAEDKAKELQRR